LIVSVIQSIYRDFGSGVVGGDTSIILQNRGAFFTLDERRPNNLQPGKRPFHGLAFGSMGGEGQPQSQAALVTRILDFGYGVREAIEAPRWLMGWTWGTRSRDPWLECRASPEVVAELKRRGQRVRVIAD
jgi:gamma-glutamyltranspeptidase/glutathione hydrolase